MRFLWDDHNSKHIAEHGVSTELAERLFREGMANMQRSRLRHRYLLEAEVEGRTYRLVCDISTAGSVYPVTCFRI